MNKLIYYDYVFSQESLDIFWKENIDNKWLLADKDNTSLGYRNRDIIFSGQGGFRNAPPLNDLICSYLDNLKSKHKDQFIEGLEVSKNRCFSDEKIARYNVGNDYEWHSDDWASRPDARRQLSTITYLNDDYIGGETEFEDLTIVPKKGKTLIFPSHWEFIHRGKKVIEGVKYVYINHIWF
tara:strand:+ start:56 stop:598 length:543 start_codon:yes stop_codon:yes gene_type:complete